MVVTGSSTGIGRACAIHLDELGFEVLAGVRRAEDADQLRAVSSGRLEPLIFDVTAPADIDAAARRVSAAGGTRVVGLVNNAGIAVGGPLELLPIDEFRRQIEVNLIGQVAVTQAFLPAIRRARGRIVFMSSIGGILATPYLAPYHASKFALEAVADSLRQELRPFGVAVSIVEPGSVATPIWEKGQARADSLLKTLTAEGQELYGERAARRVEELRAVAARGVSAEKVAGVVGRALTARRPRPRYPVGTDARTVAALRRMLPYRLLDRLTGRP